MVVLAVSTAGCSSHPAGLGRKACPYLRPRLLRLDRALAAGSTNDIVAVDQDIALFVRNNLPAGGKGPADRQLAAFSTALDQFVHHAGNPADLTAAEDAVKRVCGVSDLGAVVPREVLRWS